jgi:hypothetical protein
MPLSDTTRYNAKWESHLRSSNPIEAIDQNTLAIRRLPAELYSQAFKGFTGKTDSDASGNRG